MPSELKHIQKLNHLFFFFFFFFFYNSITKIFFYFGYWIIKKEKMILGLRHVQKLANQISNLNYELWDSGSFLKNTRFSVLQHNCAKSKQNLQKNGRSKHACLLDDQATNFWFSDISQSMVSSCFPLNSRNSSRKFISFKLQPAETIKKQLFDNHLNFSAEREYNQLFSNLILYKASNLKLK